MSFDEEGFLSEQTAEFRKRNRAQYAGLFSLINNLNRYAHKVKFSFNIHGNDLQEVICAALFIRLLNSYAAAVRLAEVGLCHDAEAICRVAMEALFHLKSCAEDNKTAIAYVKSDQRDRLKLIGLMKNKTSSLHELVKSGQFQGVDAIFDAIKKEVDEEKIAERIAYNAATKAKLDGFYDYAYRMLSHSVHSSPRTIAKYARVDEETGEAREVFSAPEEDTIPLISITALATLLTALGVMGDLFKVEMPKLTEFQERFKALDRDHSKEGQKDKSHEGT